MKKLAVLLAMCAFCVLQSAAQGGDWANYGRYAQANAELKGRPEVVFMGNSITEGWARQHPDFFTENNYVGRGISGQVTAQMLARFQNDVIALSPRVVVILAGTNDIALNNGYVSLEHIAQNIRSMAQLAAANGIKPVVCSVLPAAAYGWRPEVTDSAEQVAELNRMLQTMAKANKWPYVDFWSAMNDGNGGLPAELAADGIHPTAKGYDKMEEIIVPVLKKILKK